MPGKLKEIELDKDQAWLVAIVRCFFFTFQCASCYFVLLIVILRAITIKKPMRFDDIHEKITKPFCIVIWFFVVLLNTIPILMGSSEVTGQLDPISKRNLLALTYTVVLHLGVTIPLILSILCNLFLGLYLAKNSIASGGFTSQEEKKRKSFQKLINGLVIWLIVCNVPYISWVHYSISTMVAHNIPWLGNEGVINSKEALSTSYPNFNT